MSNKRRLYIAFFHQEATEENPIKFHTAFLVTPKRPKTKTDNKASWAYHVVNRIDADTKEDTWFFEPKPSRSRTVQLAGLMLLGKIPDSMPDAMLQHILDQVPRHTLVKTDQTWRCRHWVCAALPILVAQNVIPALPAGPSDVWQNGIIFVGKQGVTKASDPLPCCNTSGNQIPSEIGPM